MKDNLEIERKILGIDKNSLIKRINLLKPKPKKLFEGLVRIKYFDFQDGRIRAKRDLLRIREFFPKKSKTYVEFVYKIYKGVKKGCKCFKEIEFKFSGENVFCEMEVFLKKLGLKQTLYYEKKRTLFAYGKAHFELDEHPRIPAFLEIEAMSSLIVEKMIKLLGLAKNEQTSNSIGELMKRKYPKISLNGLKF